VSKKLDQEVTSETMWNKRKGESKTRAKIGSKK